MREAASADLARDFNRAPRLSDARANDLRVENASSYALRLERASAHNTISPTTGPGHDPLQTCPLLDKVFVENYMNQASAPPSAPGSIIASGRYSMLGELGSGGMATVHRVVDLATGVDVALKRLRPQVDVEARNRGIAHLEREFHTLSQLAHPRVVSVFDYGVDGSDPYYTMELLDGGDLQERTPLAAHGLRGRARRVLGALLMHSRRLVHRDRAAQCALYQRWPRQVDRLVRWSR
jgi:serine/threonine protein kinase